MSRTNSQPLFTIAASVVSTKFIAGRFVVITPTDSPVQPGLVEIDPESFRQAALKFLQSDQLSWNASPLRFTGEHSTVYLSKQVAGDESYVTIHLLSLGSRAAAFMIHWNVFMRLLDDLKA